MTPERTIARRLEIVHESLLTKWPRLLRWRTQDAEGAQLRDELRQAARTWHEHGRSDDLLWTGSAYREFQVWRERYPGRLTEVEEAFAAAMAALAGRLKRRRRLAVAAILSTLVVGLGVVGSFWRHSVLEARRAEAAKLLALGQLAIEASPSAAVAYAIASLELADTTESRLLALKALWRGPTAFVVTEDGSRSPRFSPDGRWAAYGAWSPELEVRMLRADGSTRVLEQPYEESMHLWDIGPGSDVLLTAARSFPSPRLLELRSAPEGRHLAELRYQDRSWLGGVSWNDERLLVLISENGEGHVDALSFNGSQERLGGLGFDFRPDENGHSPAVVAMDRRTGRWLGAVVENEVQVFEVGEHDLSKPRRLGRQEGPEIRLAFDPLGRYLATANQLGQIRLWDPKGTSPLTILEGPPGLQYLAAYGDGGLLVAAFLEDEHRKVWVWSVAGGKPTLLRRFDLGRQAPAAGWTIDPVGRTSPGSTGTRRIRLWPFGAPADAEPILLGRDEQGQIWAPSFDPQGHWLATASGSGLLSIHFRAPTLRYCATACSGSARWRSRRMGVGSLRAQFRLRQDLAARRRGAVRGPDVVPGRSFRPTLDRAADASRDLFRRRAGPGEHYQWWGEGQSAALPGWQHSNGVARLSTLHIGSGFQSGWTVRGRRRGHVRRGGEPDPGLGRGSRVRS